MNCRRIAFQTYLESVEPQELAVKKSKSKAKGFLIKTNWFFPRARSMAYPKSVMQFFEKNKVFYSTFLHHIDQKRILSKYISLKLNLENGKPEKRILCIGGGSGEGDLGVIKKLKCKDFVIDCVDPSKQMLKVFARNAKKAGLGRNLGELIVSKFESASFIPTKADIALCINSLYFVEGWKSKVKNNPLKKIYDCLNDGGVAVIVIRSGESDHCIVKRIVGGGRTSGLLVRKKLKELGIPHFFEVIPSRIDLSDCFKKGIFKPNSKGLKLLSFLFGDRWRKLSPIKRYKVIKVLKEKLKIFKGRLVLEAKHEYIWVCKPSGKKNNVSEKAVSEKAKKLALKIRNKLRTVPNFPVKGITFRDTTPILRDSKLFEEIIEYARRKYKGKDIDFVVAKDMQALIWAGAIAKALKCGVVPMFRKDLAGSVLTAVYEHEYNPNRVVNLQKEAIKKGNRVLLVDYIIATGETMRVMASLVEHLGGKIVGIFSIIELESLNCRKGLEKYDVHSLVKF